MDFFEQQTRAHRKTQWLIVYFAMAVIGMIAATYAGVIVIFTGVMSRHHGHFQSGPLNFSLWNPQVFLIVSLATLAVVIIGSVYKTMSLSSGGSAVSELMGGRLINSNTSDPDERKLINVVEEMSIASGVPMPQVYVMDGEGGVNAFAAGHQASDATITVTRGCMKLLSRDELQGVIGHEYSHILNGDMRLNLRLMGTIFGILCLAIIGRVLLQTARGGGRSRGQNPLPLLGLLLLLVGSIGVFFGRLIQAAVSRQREFLADASSVQFTRNPSGITGALKKIGGLGEAGAHISHAHAQELSHMFFGDGIGAGFMGLFETHPPLTARIRVFEPAFDGVFPPVRDAAPQMATAGVSASRGPTMPQIFGTMMGGVLAGGNPSPGTQAHAVLPNLGNPTPQHLKYAEQLRDSLPEDIRAAAREPLDATALIYAMLLSSDDDLRARQLAELEQRAGAEARAKAESLFAAVSNAATHAHLPIIMLALGALKQLTAEQYEVFSKTLDWLINSHGKIELFDFVLQKIVLRHLDSQFHGARKQIIQFYTPKPLTPDCAVVLSAFAHVSSNDPGEIQNAFDTGAPYWRGPAGCPLQLLTREQCGVEQIDAALNRLAQAAPVIKKNLIEACVHAVGADGVIVENEAELLRAVSDTLDCPMPPFVTADESAECKAD